MKTKIGLLSGGQRQVVTLLMCTICTPKLLLLDEHTAALDPVTAKKVMDITNEIVAENNITTMMITHNMSSALATGDRTIMMDSGRIIIDLDKEQKAHMTVSDLLALYREKETKEFDTDRICCKRGADPMKCISWNVNGLRACMGKGFADFLLRQTRTCFACKKRNCKQGRSTLRPRATTPTGTMRRKRATPAPPSSLSGSRCGCSTAWARRSTTGRGG